MRPVSQRWLDAVRGSHHAVFEVLVCEPGQTGTSPVGTLVDIQGGNVQFDIESDVLATAEVIVSDASLYPDSPDDLLAPYGNELFIRRGIDYGGGAVEWVSLGYFRINSVEQDDARGGPLRVQGQDRMWRIIKNPRSIYELPGTDTRGSAVAFAIATASITTTIEWDDTALRDGAMGRALQFKDNRWDTLNDFITGLNKVWYYDYRGILVIKSPPSPTATVWTADSGSLGVMTSLGRSVSDDGMYNEIETRSSNVQAGIPVGAVWSDGDITSPTWTGSKFGVVSQVVEESSLITVPQANALARQIMETALATPYSIDLTTVPNAALEVYDPIRAHMRTPTGVDVDETHIVRKMSVPLSVDGDFPIETKKYTP